LNFIIYDYYDAVWYVQMLDRAVAICEVHPNRLSADAYLEHSHKLRKQLTANIAQITPGGESSRDHHQQVTPDPATHTSASPKKIMRRKRKKKTKTIANDEL
jgi:hypothetical protein